MPDTSDPRLELRCKVTEHGEIELDPNSRRMLIEHANLFVDHECTLTLSQRPSRWEVQGIRRYYYGVLIPVFKRFMAYDMGHNEWASATKDQVHEYLKERFCDGQSTTELTHEGFHFYVQRIEAWLAEYHIQTSEAAYRGLLLFQNLDKTRTHENQHSD